MMLVQAQGSSDLAAETATLRKLFPLHKRPGRQHSLRSITDRLIETLVFGMNDCWIWRGPTNKFGYGRFSYKGRTQVAHRISYETFVGKIPDGLSVLHRCDNPSCINPEHLWLGTYSDNIRDAWAKGRNKGRTGHRKVKP